MTSFDNKVVFITGASAGIGQGAAIEFAREGATLALTGRNQERLSETATKCTAVGLSEDKIYLVTGDLENDEELRKVFDAVISHYGRLDVLVNNAGAILMEDFATSSLGSLDLMYRHHVRIPWELSRLAVPHLEKTKGSIVNVSSVCSTLAFKGAAAYSSMKAAMDHFTRIIAHELVTKGIRANSVNLGTTRTPAVERIAKGMGGGDIEKGCEILDDLYPVGRMGTPDEIGRAIVFLASPNSGFLIGTNLLIDGGISLAGAGRFGQ